MINLDLPADVIWVPADQIPETGVNAGRLLAMDELSIADRANLWIATEEGNLTIEQIEQLHRALSK